MKASLLSFQKVFAFAVLGILVVLLGATVSCDKKDDDDGGTSGGSAFEFKGGANPTNTGGALLPQSKKTVTSTGLAASGVAHDQFPASRNTSQALWL